MNCLLACDVGTTGAKAALVAVDGRVIATAFESYPLHFPRPNWAEQDPEDWWRATGTVSRDVLTRSHIRPTQVLGLAFSTQLLNVIPLDAQGGILRPSISWMDGRAGNEARQIMRRIGGKTLFGLLAGAELTGKDVLPKYLWLKRYEPQVMARAATLMDASGYLLYKTTGRLACEWSVASVTGLFSLRTKTWNRALMRLFGLSPAMFPDLVQSTERVGGLTAEAAAHLGLMEGTPVFGGAGDAMTSAVGSGAVSDGDGHLSLGTSSFVGIMTRRRMAGRHGIATIQSADPEKLLLIGENETSAACLKWAARHLYESNGEDASVYIQMDDDVSRTPPGADGLIFTPWMYGERCPVADETLRAGFFNLGMNHTRAHMVRAIYEGTAYNIHWTLDSIERLYRLRPDPLRVVGGGAQGFSWLKIIADVTGRTLECVANPHHAGAVGAALLAAVGLGVYPSIVAVKSVVCPIDVIKPGPNSGCSYDRSYAAFREIYHSLKGVYKTFNRPGGE